MRCESCVYFVADEQRCELKKLPLERIIVEGCGLYTEGFRTTLYEVLLMDGTQITIDVSPRQIGDDWVAVRTYKQVYQNKGGHHFEQGWLFNIRPSMIVGYRLLEDCEVIM